MATRTGQPILLWAACWPSRRFSILSARRQERLVYAARRVGATDDGWPESCDPPLPDLVPVHAFELGIASRKHDNVPRFLSARFRDQNFTWTREQSRGTTAEQPEDDPGGPVIGKTSIWGYVSDQMEAVVLTAPDIDAAARRVLASASRWGIEAPAQDYHVVHRIEPIERIEVQIRAREEGIEPFCYRLWIEGIKVGWPRVPEEPGGRFNPPDDDDRNRLPAELRLPIPRFPLPPARRPRRRRWKVVPQPDSA
jgi:hypothetical protein